MKKFLAKSNGLDSIREHSEKVKNNCLEIFHKIKGDLGDEEEFFIDVIEKSALLHDIGKFSKSFQDYILKGKVSKDYFLHNEVGWAFLKKYSIIKDSEKRNFILDSVLFHHGVRNIENNIGDILSTLTKKDIDNMLNYLKECYGKQFIKQTPSIRKEIKFPYYYGNIYDEEDSNEDAKLMFFRNILISGDRLLHEGGGKIDRKNKIDFNLDNFELNERLKQQKEIANVDSKNVVVNAPAGFGKTLTGLLWNLKRGKRKLIWVCPRNIVAEQVYKSVLKELNAIGDKHTTAQLFIASEVKEMNNEVDLEFDSDIIITNIDNFLAPNLNNSILSRMYYLLGCDLIFDEYHELVSNSPYFALYINIMNMRTLFTNSKTMLLSATPDNSYFLWDKECESTKILPNKHEHYIPAHDKKYKLNVLENRGDLDLNQKDSLYILNNIDNAQNFELDRRVDGHDENVIFHSKFEDSKKEEIVGFLYKNYGKENGVCSGENKSVTGTLVLQSSLDVSFTRLNESVFSHFSTMQRIGRCNRWGEKDNSEINVFLDPRDNGIVRFLYNNDLRIKWYDFLNKINNSYITLSELYEHYNTFSKENEKEIREFLESKQKESNDNLRNIQFIKYNSRKKIDGAIKKSGGNKLRSTGNEIFYTCRNVNEYGWCDPFSEKVNGGDFDRHFAEESGDLEKIKKHIKNTLSKDERFEFGNKYQTKKTTLDKLRKQAVYNTSPYVVLRKFYDKDFGVVSEATKYRIEQNNFN